MKRYVIANWKCHKSSSDGRKWLDNFGSIYKAQENVEVILAPSMVSLESIALYLQQNPLADFSLAAQDISPFPRGNYTGAVAADMVKKMARYAIIGHSERRRYFHETEQDIINKVTEVADCGLIPIVCLESLDDLIALHPLADVDCEQILVAYTPVDALNFKIPESPEKVRETVEEIVSRNNKVAVVYGGALHVDNVAEYAALDCLSGFFVGASSLDPSDFAEFYNKAVI